MIKIFENEVGYFIMFALIVAQCTVGEWFFFGQAIYLIANIVNVVRDFVLNRPKSDKIKNVSFSAITVSLILIRTKHIWVQIVFLIKYKYLLL